MRKEYNFRTLRAIVDAHHMDYKTQVKIRNGTRSGKRLCDSCASGQVMKGDAESEEFIWCRSLDREVPITVVECTDYQNKGVPQLHEMRSIAWILRTDKSGQQIGFVSPDRWKADKDLRRLIEDDE